MQSIFLRSFQKIKHNFQLFWSNGLARTVGLTFAADSFMFGSWVTHIPHVKSHLGLNDATLGLALFGMPLGLLLMNPISPRLIARFGLAPVTTFSTLAVALSFALPVWMPDRWSLMLALVLVGAGVAVMNVAMNTCATNIEKAEGVYIMSTCHGMWSMGGMLGSGLSALLIRIGVWPEIHLNAVALVVLLLAWFRWRPVLALVPDDERSNALRSGSPGFVWPNPVLLLMIFIGLCTSLCEGVAFDWSAVYLRDHLGAAPALAALAFTCFSLTMMALRFTGDVLLPRFGQKRLLYFTAAFSAFSMLVLVVAPTPALGMLGFFYAGCWCGSGSAHPVQRRRQGAGIRSRRRFGHLCHF
ncbi:MAG: MFS transporter [Lewinellaceae bacterium]|nr:MFS transporter [Lewinellaceae bacterium]